ncbi:MAG: 3-deoxy-8-phosphooctulonate synthase [Sphingobacteriales bacterium]|jgi:2-dehydro-3-deoxyphosphooctonate aldolase (KDO 8-P synthase)|nr:3-deoxy-8-phosphooctulonate synthase [Sphingobacteriales bacterium]
MLQNIPRLHHTDTDNFFLLAGTCVVESEEITFQTAQRLKEITSRLEIPFVFKASYRKANRTRIDSYTGPGDELALMTLKRVADQLDLPLVTDIHESHEAQMAAEYVDILQIPAFLCRQTDLLVAAAKTGKTVNIKKGQFLSPEAMQFAIRKVVDSGNNHVMLTERGSMFGYSDMIVDFRSIPTMQSFGHPVVMDITHSVQQPNQNSGVTGGRPELISTIARAAIAAGADGIFLETHPNPAEALSDGANMIPLDKVEELLRDLIRIRRAVRASSH